MNTVITNRMIIKKEKEENLTALTSINYKIKYLYIYIYMYVPFDIYTNKMGTNCCDRH